MCISPTLISSRSGALTIRLLLRDGAILLLHDCLIVLLSINPGLLMFLLTTNLFSVDDHRLHLFAVLPRCVMRWILIVRIVRLIIVVAVPTRG